MITSFCDMKIDKIAHAQLIFSMHSPFHPLHTATASNVISIDLNIDSQSVFNPNHALVNCDLTVSQILISGEI